LKFIPEIEISRIMGEAMCKIFVAAKNQKLL
jgi:hypothetical protein